MVVIRGQGRGQGQGSGDGQGSRQVTVGGGGRGKLRSHHILYIESLSDTPRKLHISMLRVSFFLCNVSRRFQMKLNGNINDKHYMTSSYDYIVVSRFKT